jgi:hypothetical protein
MLGIRYIKASPTTYVLQYRGGKVVREGVGLAFFFFEANSTIVQVPVSSRDVPFVFNETTADFQDATIQGELTYRIKSPKEIAGLLDFSVDGYGRHRSDDPSKLGERLVHAVQILARSFTQKRNLKELLVSSDQLVAEVQEGLRKSDSVARLGVEVLELSLVGIRPAPEMAKALQADAREDLLRKADEAVYARRNKAVELERTIKENELKTQLAVEEKQRQIRETQMAAEIAVEQQRAMLVDSRVENERKETEAKAAGLAAMLEPVKNLEWRTLLALHSGSDSGQIMSLAFQELAQNAGKIGELNISPDLLTTLMRTRRAKE